MLITMSKLTSATSPTLSLSVFTNASATDTSEVDSVVNSASVRLADALAVVSFAETSVIFDRTSFTASVEEVFKFLI